MEGQAFVPEQTFGGQERKLRAQVLRNFVTVGSDHALSRLQYQCCREGLHWVAWWPPPMDGGHQTGLEMLRKSNEA
jgi:hypothetical protein